MRLRQALREEGLLPSWTASSLISIHEGTKWQSKRWQGYGPFSLHLVLPQLYKRAGLLADSFRFSGRRRQATAYNRYLRNIYVKPSQYKENGKVIAATGWGGPQGCETSMLPHLLDNRFTDGNKVVSLTPRPHFTLVFISVRCWVDHRAIVRPELYGAEHYSKGH
jgi:hypothetical protein